MIRLKQHIAYTFLCCYVLTTLSGLCVLIGAFEASNPVAIGIYATSIAQTATIIVAFIKAPEYFKDPDAIITLQKDHAQTISELQSDLAKCIKDHENMIAYIGTKIMPDDPQHPLYSWMHAQANPIQSRADS